MRVRPCLTVFTVLLLLGVLLGGVLARASTKFDAIELMEEDGVDPFVQALDDARTSLWTIAADETNSEMDLTTAAAGWGINLTGASAAAGTANTTATVTGSFPIHTTGTLTDVLLQLSPTFAAATGATTTQLGLQATISTPAWASGTHTISGIKVTPTIGNASGGTNTVNLIEVGAVTGDAQVTLTGFKIGALTGTGATETAISIGAGWDYALSMASPVAFTSGLDVTGAAINLNASSNYAVNIATGTSTGAVTIGGSAGNTIAVGTNNTVADDIDIGSALDDLDLEGEDITLDTADDGNATVADDWTFTMESAGGIFAVGGTAGSVFNLYTDDTTADDINIGSAKDDVTIAGEDITLDTADDGDATVADDFTFTMESAGGIFAVGGTAGSVINIYTDDTTADDINIGSAKDDITLAAEDITLTTADDVDITSTSAGGIIALGGTAGQVFNVATDDTTADTINIGSAKDTTTINGTLATATGVGAIVANKATAVEQMPLVHTTVVTFTLTGDNDLDLADGDHGTGVKVYDFPEGRIQILGVTVNASVTTNDAYNANPNDIFYLALGSAVGADDNDLTSTEADLSAKATLDTVGNTTLTLDWQAALAATAQFDGTTTPLDMYVNVAIADTSNTKASTFAITGTATVSWVNLGDY